MSFDEVQRGLPPVYVVNSPTRRSRIPTPKFLKEDSDNDSYRSEVEEQPISSIKTKPPIPPKPTKKNSNSKFPNDKEMAIFRTMPVGSAWGYPESLQDDNLPPEDDISRSRKYGGFVLIFLPPIFFALAVQFLKFLMGKFQVYVLAVCVFQGVLWPALIYLVILVVTGRRDFLESIKCSAEGSRNIFELLLYWALQFLGGIASGAVILQIYSLQLLDITVSLAITFSPLIIAAFIEHIHRERRFPVGLLISTIISYLGITLVAIPALFLNHRRSRDELILGIGASVGSMLLTIPASLQLSRLRRKKVNDCISASFFGGVGTLIAIVFGVTLNIVRGIPKENDGDPWKILGLIGFIALGTFFQIFEANVRTSRKRVANLSRTRAGVFILSGIWQIFKISFISEGSSFPYVFTIFGVFLLVFSYLFTSAFQIWFEEKKRKSENDERDLNLIPWLFARKVY